MLSRWINEYDENYKEAFRGNGNSAMIELENKVLKRRINKLENQLKIKEEFEAFSKKKNIKFAYFAKH